MTNTPTSHIHCTVKQLVSVCWLLACLTSQQHARVAQRQICSDNCTCCHRLKLRVSTSHSLFTPGQPVIALNSTMPAPAKVNTRVPMFLLLFLCSKLHLWGSPFFFFFCIPSYISGVHHSSSAFPARSLGFTIFLLLLLRSQLDLWGSPFWVIFLCT